MNQADYLKREEKEFLDFPMYDHNGSMIVKQDEDFLQETPQISTPIINGQRVSQPDLKPAGRWRGPSGDNEDES